MIIEVHTIRKISDNDYKEFIDSLNYYGIPVDGDKLYKDKSFTINNKDDVTEVTTTYKILEESK